MVDNLVQTYSYNLATKLFFYVFSIILVVLNLFLGIQLTLKIITFLNGSTNISSIIGLIIALSIFGFCLALCSNVYPNVKVYNTGLKVQVFSIWWIFIPWVEIDGIWTIGGFVKQYVVAVRALTPFHRVIGMGYGSLKPVFPITQRLKGSDQLIKLIEQNIQKAV